jgi:PAS domain S-box-containing protein
MSSTVLVVEDEALVADDIQRTLTRLGYHVPHTAGTAAEALALTASLKPQLVLMDIHLDGEMDGIEAAELVRVRHGVPVVFLTAYSDDATLERAKHSQPFGYLLKPFNERELRTAIEVSLHRHTLESQLSARERWFKTTLHSIGDAVIAIDARETVTFMNSTALLLTGVPEAAALGQPLSEVFRLIDAQGVGVASPLRRALESRRAVHLEPDLRLVRGAGAPLDIDDCAAPIFDDHGRLLGAVVVFRDISERKALEERVRRSDRLASIGTLSAGIAHEINNPLTYIVLNTALALTSLQSATAQLDGALSKEPEVQATVDKARAELHGMQELLLESREGAQRVRHIIDDVRRFARAEVLERTALKPSALMDTAVNLTRLQLSQAATLTVTHGPAPEVLANEGQLLQVLTNLLTNAVQAVAGQAPARARVRVRTGTDGEGRAVLEVSDTGVGISPDILERIFDPFFTTKPVGSGTGLGLSISHGIVTAHHGELQVSTEPGVGSTFRVVLPPV